MECSKEITFDVNRYWYLFIGKILKASKSGENHFFCIKDQKKEILSLRTKKVTVNVEKNGNFGNGRIL